MSHSWTKEDNIYTCSRCGFQKLSYAGASPKCVRWVDRLEATLDQLEDYIRTKFDRDMAVLKSYRNSTCMNGDGI